MTERLLYDKSAAAEALSCTDRHIDELRRGGKLTSVWDGYRHLYRRQDLEDYVNSLPVRLP